MGNSTPPILRVVSAGWQCASPVSSFAGKPQTTTLLPTGTARAGRARGSISSHDILGGHMGARDTAEAECASCHQSFEVLVVHNEATNTYLCKPCDEFWSCSVCGRAYLNDGAIILTGMCSGCASDALTRGE